MKSRYLYFMAGILTVSLFLLGYVYSVKVNRSPSVTSRGLSLIPTTTPIPTSVPKTLPPVRILPQGTQMFQSFNNCGPATVGMILSRYGIRIPQQQLANELRPNNNHQGINDDKSVTFPELAEYARKHNLVAYYRPNGSIEKLKQFVSADIAVVTRTWLNPGEDIGHYRVVRGYDDTTGEIVQDDSYHSPNLRYSYDVFLSMWQPFNYDYLVIAPKEKEAEIHSILKEEVDEKTAWNNALENAKKEADKGSSPYPVFNMAVATYYLENPQETVKLFKKVSAELPRRMLWYQIEPIQAYQQLGNAAKVFELTDQILNSGNLGYSELYEIRSKTLLDQNRKVEARVEFEKALYYHNGSKTVLQLLQSI